MMEALRWLNLRRRTAWVASGASLALAQRAFMMRWVLPDRAPPASSTWIASPARASQPACCHGSMSSTSFHPRHLGRYDDLDPVARDGDLLARLRLAASRHAVHGVVEVEGLELVVHLHLHALLLLALPVLPLPNPPPLIFPDGLP